MLPVIIFIVFWVVLALGVFFTAVRGGPSGARMAFQTQSPGGRRALGTIFAIVYIGFGIAIPLAFLSGNHAKANDRVGRVKLTTADKRGREVFGQHCGVCHTLAAANAVGKVGPNLDSLKPSKELVLNTINNGCVQNPSSPSAPDACLGQGTMPSGIVQGRDAENVSSFVAKVAGKE